MLTEEEKQHNKEIYREKMKKRNKKAWIIFGIFIFLCFFGNLIWGIIGVNIHYSEGQRSVKIIKLSEKGLFWKTWEAEGVLAQQGFSVTYIWPFSVDNQDPNKAQLVEKLKNAFETGNTVIIKYDQRYGKVPWRSETSYFVKGITSH